MKLFNKNQPNAVEIGAVIGTTIIMLWSMML